MSPLKERKSGQGHAKWVEVGVISGQLVRTAMSKQGPQWSERTTGGSLQGTLLAVGRAKSKSPRKERAWWVLATGRRPIWLNTLIQKTKKSWISCRRRGRVVCAFRSSTFNWSVMRSPWMFGSGGGVWLDLHFLKIALCPTYQSLWWRILLYIKRRTIPPLYSHMVIKSVLFTNSETTLNMCELSFKTWVC